MSEISFRLGQLPLVKFLRSTGKTAFSRRYLLLTNTAITVGLSGTGDVLQQRYEMMSKRQKGWDSHRTRNICTTGLFIGPTCHYWYLLLDRFLPGKAIRTITQKILVDQIVFSPVNISMFLVLMGYLEGSSTKQIKMELKREGVDLFKAECVVWPPAQYINFYFLPPHLRVLFDNSISLAFDCYYSYVKYRKYKPLASCQEDGSLESTLEPTGEPHNPGLITAKHKDKTTHDETEKERVVCRGIQHCNRAFRMI